MEIVKQKLLTLWARYWLRHILQKAAEVALGAAVVGGAVTTVVAVSPVHHKPSAHAPVAVKAAPVPKPAVHHPVAVASAPPAPTPAPATQNAVQPPVASQAPQPIPASQPSPGTGVKQLVPTPTSSPSTTPSTSTSTSGSTSTATSTSPSSGSTSTAPPAATGGYYSTNWAGYAALSGKFTTVSGSWVVPAVTGNGTSTAGDAAWVGIGGVSSNDLIQTGTEDMVAADGTVSTFAFYELLPDPSLEIKSLKVRTGDAMAASITESSTGQWTISITDTTTGQNYTTAVAYTSTYSSAEWIEEDPSYIDGTLVPFANFDHVVFSDGATTQNGNPANITSSNAAPITLVDNTNKPIVTPSVLINSGTGFWATHD